MRELFGWDPFQETLAPRSGAAFVPAFEVTESEEGYLFKADLPGVRDEDLEIIFAGSLLTIRGKREDEGRAANETYFADERSYGPFTRTFRLPEGVDIDRADADLRDGVLTVRLPKSEAVRPKKISVRASESLKAAGQTAKGVVERVKEAVEEKVKKVVDKDERA